MAWRNPLFVKKRGGRRTGTRSVGQWSELLLSLSLVVIGAGALGLHVWRVMLPDWRESHELEGLSPGVCQIVSTQIRRRDEPLAVAEYALEIEAARVTDKGLLPPVWIDLGFTGFSPSLGDAERLARWYKPGNEYPCWFDPADPTRLYLRRQYRWWPLPVALIPASLLAVGVWGIVASLMQVATSAERRSLVSVKALRLDPLRESSAESGILSAKDLAEGASEARLAHRLPATATAAWRMMGLFFVCAIWNALLAYFGYVASRQVLRGDPPWLALGLVVVLGLIGVWLAFHLVRELWERRGIGAAQMEISEYPLTLGGEYRTHLLQPGAMEVRKLAVHLVCEEVASYQQGTNSQTSIETVHRQEIGKWSQLSIEPGRPWEAELTFKISPTAMHSFRSPHNEVRWLLLVSGETSRRQTIDRRFYLSVRPPTHDPPEAIAVDAIPQSQVTA